MFAPAGCVPPFRSGRVLGRSCPGQRAVPEDGSAGEIPLCNCAVGQPRGAAVVEDGWGVGAGAEVRPLAAEHVPCLGQVDANLVSASGLEAAGDDRRTVEVGTLTVQQIEAEADGPCRDINFDPTVLPAGIRISDDPFPAARSSVYAKSYDLRTAESKDYPRTAESTRP